MEVGNDWIGPCECASCLHGTVGRMVAPASELTAKCERFEEVKIGSQMCWRVGKNLNKKKIYIYIYSLFIFTSKYFFKPKKKKKIPV
jgi:hypothetical protein